MELLGKSDFGRDLTKFDGLSPMECLLIVAEKAWEKINVTSHVEVDKGKELQCIQEVQCVDDHRQQKRKEKGNKIYEDDEDFQFEHRRKGKGIKTYDDDEDFRLKKQKVKKQTCNKRTYVHDDNEAGPSSNAQPRPKKRGTNHSVQHAELPDRYKNRIEEMGGSDVKLVIEKKLTASDKCSNLNRLNMIEANLLPVTTEELRMVGTKVAVDVIEPNDELSLTTLIFTFWKSLGWYVFIGDWKYVANSTENNLREGDNVQIWKFRLPSGRTGFAIVKL